MDVHELADFERLAEATLSPQAFAYYAGGSWDEVTLSDNQAAFRRRTLRPRVLTDVSNVDTSTTVLGAKVSLPVGIAPAALQGLAHGEGEIVPARVAGREGLIYGLSTFANRSIETVASVGRGTRWFQLYVQRDRGLSEALVARAAEAGYAAIVLTVDLPRPGYRVRERRMPVGDPGTLGNVPPPRPGDQYLDVVLHENDASMTWADLAWLRSLSPLPLVLKGILTPDDARLAVEHGAAAIWVSNHGGRQLDRVSATIDALEPVVEAVDGRAEVYLDGGVRRGTDVVTALALGARAVFIGRPFLYALAAAGEAGVARAVEIVREETSIAMALLGCPTIDAITRDRVA
ncbi:MAG TPA: alpha-hydroxy acid oxidase [Candidatus Limnocylindrales bacterium]|jgi:4-hydroxymandelate oxidase